MKILVVNCGSSSLKFQFIDSEKEEVLAKGVCERIGIDGTLTYAKEGHAKETVDKDMPTHTEAIRYVLDALMDSAKGVIKSLSEVDAVGHRVVHGGEKFTSSVLIDDAVIDYIKECSDLAPLHNPANLIGIEACKKLCRMFLWLRFLILHFIRRCLRKHICTAFLWNIMTNIL